MYQKQDYEKWNQNEQLMYTGICSEIKTRYFSNSSSFPLLLFLPAPSHSPQQNGMVFKIPYGDLLPSLKEDFYKDLTIWNLIHYKQNKNLSYLIKPHCSRSSFWSGSSNRRPKVLAAKKIKERIQD